MTVPFDMHAYDEMASAPSGRRERFLALWSQIASRYRDRPDTVAFGLRNEPNLQLDSTWSHIAAAAITTVRATNPRRLLVVDTVFWADPSKISSLQQSARGGRGRGQENALLTATEGRGRGTAGEL